nr:intersectin-2-like [Oncorhynchus nerka]
MQAEPQYRCIFYRTMQAEPQYAASLPGPCKMSRSYAASFTGPCKLSRSTLHLHLYRTMQAEPQYAASFTGPCKLSRTLPMSCFSSPMAFSPSAGISKANSLLDLSSSSSNSSSTTSLASNSPKTCSCDWSVPQSTRLKYRQQFNSLDKLMSGYLSGPQVRNALIASNLTQTQLATIWTLADVDKDGQLRAEEFILAMHLVDMVTTGCPLPLTLPSDLVPPCLRDSRPVEMLNGTGPYLSTGLIDGTAELEPAHKNKNNGT